jgi:hypothetical protein
MQVLSALGHELLVGDAGARAVRNGSATPREEGFAKRTQIILLEGWSADASRRV